MKKHKHRWLTKEFCESVARKFKTLRAFWSGDWSVAFKAMSEGWLDEYTWLKRQRVKRGTYSKEECRRLAKKCKTLSEFTTRYRCAEVISRRNGWLKEFTWLELQHVSPVRWTTEALVKESKKYKTLSDFYKGNRNAYCVAYRHGLIGQFTWLERKRKLTEEYCKSVAKTFNTMKDFWSKCHNVAAKAHKTGWIESYTWLKRERPGRK